MTPATIRYGNPGGQYPGPSARRWGSTGTEIIGGGHKIAVFPDPVKGAAAQFDLLNRGYAGLPLNQAIRKWSGGNSADAYVQGIVRDTGLAPDTVLTPQLLSSPQGLALVKRMAQHEAGRPYPLDDTQWSTAQRMALGGNTEGAAVAPKPGSAEYWNSTRARPGQQSMPPLVSQMATGQPGQPQQQQGGWNLYDALTNPLTMMGLSILGSPTRDVGQGIQTFQQGRAYDDRRAEMARQRMVEEQQQKAFQGAVAGAGDLGPMAPVIQALGPERGSTLLAQLLKEQRDAATAGKYGKDGALFYDPATKKHYTAQFASDGTRKIEPIEVGGNALEPAKGVDRVGNELVSKATGNTVRDVGQQIEQGEFRQGVGKDNADFVGKYPKVEASYKSFAQKNKSLVGMIDKAIGSIAPNTTGWASLLANMPETQAKALQGYIQTIKGNLAFSEIQDMRNNSPTGGALGNVTERELDLLTSTQAAMDQALSGVNLKENLQLIRENMVTIQRLRDEAFVQDQAKHRALTNNQSAGDVLARRGGQSFVGGETPAANGGWGIRKID